MQGDGQSYNLEFQLGEYTLDLSVVSVRLPVLHQGIRLANLGPVGDTFYYSRTRMELTGSISIYGEESPVTGATWLNHQWGDVTNQQVGWAWTGVQLDVNRSLLGAQSEA